MDASEISDTKNLKRVAKILGVSEQGVIEAFTRKTIFAQGERVVRDLRAFPGILSFFRLLPVRKIS